MQESYSKRLSLIGTLTEPITRQAICAMSLPRGSIGLDAGCGIGTHTFLLAEETGPSGEVIGMDTSGENLKYARKAAADKGLSKRVRFLRKDIRHLPFSADSLDWVWCADVLWPVSGMNPPEVLREFHRVVRPGGQIGILFWTTQVLLPGFPILEIRLNLAHAHTNPYLKDISPALHFLRANVWLRSAGLVEIGMKSFLAEIQAPLSQKKRRAMAYCFDMLWGNLETHVSAEEWSLFQRLCHPQSNTCIYDDPDYHALIVYTLFHATIPEPGGCRKMNHVRGIKKRG